MKDIIKGIADRLSGPIYGYISVSLVLFNWKWIALLFMSKHPVEVRITVIEQYFNWWLGFVAPLASGVAMALLTPFFHVVLAWIHRWANKLALKVQVYIAADKAMADELLAASDAKSQWAATIAEAAQEYEQKRIQKLAVEVETDIKKIRDQAQSLSKHHNENLGKFRELELEVINSLYLLEQVTNLAETAKLTLPDNKYLNELIAERGKFLKRYRDKFDGEDLPDFLKLNVDGLINFPQAEPSNEKVQ